MRYYYAATDENRVLCVDQLDEHWRPSGWDEEEVAGLAEQYPDTIYFIVDNRFPETRVP